MKKFNKGGLNKPQKTLMPEKIKANYFNQIPMTSLKIQDKIINGNIINHYYLEYIDNLIKFHKDEKEPIKNYNSVIKYIKDYKYYKKNLDYNKNVNIISFSKYKTNIIKSRINDYLSLDNFFTSNKELLINNNIKKKIRKSSYESKSLKPLFNSYSKINSSKKLKKKGGSLKPDGKELLSVMHLLDAKHDFYNNVSVNTREYMIKSYEKQLETIPSVNNRKVLNDLYGDMSKITKESYYEENILIKIINDISQGKLIEDINDYGNFQFIDINDDSTKFIYYPTIDITKMITENDTENETIIKIISDYFGYTKSIDNYKYMYDTKIFINNDISQVLSNKNKTIFSKIYDYIYMKIIKN